MLMIESFRWYGPEDQVPLSYIRQAGAKGIVTSLHHLKPGEVWNVAEIRKHQQLVADAGMEWNVVESLPVSDDIKLGSARCEEHIANYISSMKNLAECNIKCVVYNFMPVLDWVRTDLAYRLPDGSEALRFVRKEFSAFELFILKRPGAERDYPPEELAKAEEFFARLDDAGKSALERNIIDNFPGFKGVTLDDVRRALERYSGIDRQKLEKNLAHFLSSVVPTAEKLGMRLAIHPDDPPFPILGLPRIFSTQDDVRRLINIVDSPANGVDFCSGSFSANPDNDIVEMFKACAHRVNFLHLRSTARDAEGNFYEANHLEGSVDMYSLVKAAAIEQLRRRDAGRADWRIPFRPDHGHTMMDDLAKPPCPNPGYTAIGRAKGMAELRGLEMGILRSLYPGENF